MAKRDIIVIGGSAGSTGALLALVSELPADFPGSIFIVTHVPSHGAPLLGEVLQVRSQLPVGYAVDGEPIARGRIVLAPPGRHLLLTPDRVRLGLGPRENMVRPAIDPLFRSAAATYAGRVVGVVLSGMLNDGAAGLLAIRQGGGATVVQDPDDAQAPEMPWAALAATEADHLITAAAMGPLLDQLAREDAPLGRPPSREVLLDVDIAAGGRLGSHRLAEVARPVPLTCPNCAGVLSEVKGEGPLRYRCQVGHAISAEALDTELDRSLEEAIRVAMRIMEERLTLVQRMGEAARRDGRTATAELYERRAGEYREQADVLRRAAMASVLGAGPAPPIED
jgi:two-component system chemotaxis response regulator CheB